jgi:V/A-type H+-transporting ATPase subunit E
MSDETQSSGVQQLVDQLKREGVEEGEKQADQVVAKARQQAADLVDQAQREADQLLAKAKAEAQRTRAAGEEALRLAGRDAVQTLKTQLHDHFRDRVKKLVDHTLDDPQFLQRLVLEIASAAVPADADQPLRLLLPDHVATVEELGEHPESVTEPSLTKFTVDMVADTLREGISLQTSGSNEPGIRVQMVNDDVEIDLTSDAIADLLMRHLVPRFRVAMTDG